jgi:hypothetical protein
VRLRQPERRTRTLRGLSGPVTLTLRYGRDPVVSVNVQQKVWAKGVGGLRLVGF